MATRLFEGQLQLLGEEAVVERAKGGGVEVVRRYCLSGGSTRRKQNTKRRNEGNEMGRDKTNKNNHFTTYTKCLRTRDTSK